MRRVGYWISEKKSKKLNFEDHKELFRNAGLELIRIDLEVPLEQQGPFDLIVHKLTDVLARASEGYATSQKYINNIKGYLSRHPSCIVVDPLDHMHKITDRYEQYKLVLDCDVVCEDSQFFMPPFVELDTKDVEVNKKRLEQANVTYPFVCKPVQAHGSKIAHQMAIVFNEASLGDVFPPCVAQTFINHNAVLFKIFVVGDRQFIVERPSLKNLYACDKPTIFFDTQEVSKSDSTHFLNMMDNEEWGPERPVVDTARLEELAQSIRRRLGLDLIGIDVIVESETGRQGVIDINAFPGYDGVDNFFQCLVEHLVALLDARDKARPATDLNHLMKASATAVDCPAETATIDASSPNGH